MKGFDLDVAAARVRVFNDTRTVLDTNGTLICLLPTEYSFAGQVLTFPDFSKDEAYFWTWGVADNPIDSTKFQKGEWCMSTITARPQDLNGVDSRTLMAAPAGADIFIGHVRINRTTAPANTWMGRNLPVLPVTNQYIPWSGSALLEAEIGMARAMHVYIDGSGNLVLEGEQSVSVPPNGFGSFGDTPTVSNPFGGGGGEILHDGNAGIPIFIRQSKVYGYTALQTSSSSPTLMRKGSAGGNDTDGIARSPCARNDTTTYTSVYSIDVVGRFGRRS